jgi:hypothetical protein
MVPDVKYPWQKGNIIELDDEDDYSDEEEEEYEDSGDEEYEEEEDVVRKKLDLTCARSDYSLGYLDKRAAYGGGPPNVSNLCC